MSRYFFYSMSLLCIHTSILHIYVPTCVCYVGVRARVASVRLRVDAIYLNFISLSLSYFSFSPLFCVLAAAPVPLPPSLSLSLSTLSTLSVARALSGCQHEAHQGRQGGISMRRRICSPHSNTTFHPIDNGSPLKAAMVA